MSVYGGDSWAREAQHTKKRLHDLLLHGVDANGSSYNKLPSGKYACLVCSHKPVLDTPLMLSMHCKSSRHCAAESRVNEKELRRRDELSKRIALSDCSTSDAKRPKTSPSTPQLRSTSKPLIQQTRKATFEVVSTASFIQSVSTENCGAKSHHSPASVSSNYEHLKAPVGKVVAKHQYDFHEHRERELKFTAAGWKRDGNGRWYKDENVEFDSDEEDPNICLG